MLVQLSERGHPSAECTRRNSDEVACLVVIQLLKLIQLEMQQLETPKAKKNLLCKERNTNYIYIG